MERTEHTNIVNQLLSMCAPENQATASELLTQLSDDYEATLTTLETAQTNIESLTTNNENLRRVNADLFLRVGETIKKPTPTEPKPVDSQENQLTFDALFNEKGELK